MTCTNIQNPPIRVKKPDSQQSDVLKPLNKIPLHQVLKQILILIHQRIVQLMTIHTDDQTIEILS